MLELCLNYKTAQFEAISRTNPNFNIKKVTSGQRIFLQKRPHRRRDFYWGKFNVTLKCISS